MQKQGNKEKKVSKIVADLRITYIKEILKGPKLAKLNQENSLCSFSSCDVSYIYHGRYILCGFLKKKLDFLNVLGDQNKDDFAELKRYSKERISLGMVTYYSLTFA